MKKLIISLLTLLMFTGCSSNESDNNSSNAANINVEEKEDVKTSDTSFEEITICDNEYVTFKITGVDPDGFWGYTLKALIENKTDKQVMVSWDGVSVNGYMCDPYWAKDIYPGKKANVDISWLKDTLIENGIDSFEEIEFTLKVSDYNEWNTIFESEYKITLN